MTLRRKLLVLLAATAAVPVALSGFFAYRESEEALRHAINELHQRSAQAEAENAAHYVGSVGDELATAIRYENPSALTTGQTEAFLASVFLRRRGICAAALLDGSGTVLASVFVDDPGAFGRREPQFLVHDVVTAREAADFFSRAAALLTPSSRRAYLVSEPYLAQDRHKVVVAVVAPGSSARGLALAAELNLDELRSRFATSYAPSSRASLLNSKGVLIASSEPSEAPFAANAREDLAPLARAKGPGVAQYRADGRAYMAAYSPVRELGWTAVVARPTEEVVAPLRRLFESTAVVLAVALVVAILVALAVARAMARPIAQLAEGALQFSYGHFSYRLGLERKDEIGHLARTFNRMGQSVEEANRKLVRFNEELKQQVEERTRELKLAQQQLLRSQRLAAVGDLSAGIAHEMNNPLAAIVGISQILLWEAPEGSRIRTMLKDVLEQALRISDIIKDLQSLSDAERGAMASLDVQGILKAVVSTKEPELLASGIAVNTRFEARTTDVLGDEPSLRQVFSHLLSNSQNALEGRSQPRISIATSSIDAEALMIEVSDTGRGIPKQHLERIFNPFFTTKQHWTGKGLALSICHRIIENHGGKISVESEEGIGTTVTVVLPAAPPEPMLR